MPLELSSRNWTLVLPFAAFVGSGLSGCGEELHKQREVSSLRLLAVIAEEPEATPGQMTNVTAVWHDPVGREQSRAFFTWTWCTLGDPADLMSCTSEPASISGGQALDAVALRLPDEVGTVRVGVELCAEPLEASACGGDRIAAYKRIEVTARPDRRDNPVIDELRIGGQAVTEESVSVPSHGPIDVEVTAAAGPNQDDELMVSWFATGGELAAERSFDPEGRRFEVQWQPPSEPGTETFWAVLRDGHGGVGYREIALSVSAP